MLRTSYREKIRFLRGYVQNIGFQKARIEYEAHDRVAGESKYSIQKLLAFSINTIMCFSNLPLKLGIYAGIFAALLGGAVIGEYIAILFSELKDRPVYIVEKTWNLESQRRE